MPPTKLLSSSDSTDSDPSSQGVTFDPDRSSETSFIPTQWRNPRQTVPSNSYSNQQQTFPAASPIPSETSSYSLDTRTAVGASDFSDFQQSTESGSDSFQDESYYARKITFRLGNEPKSHGHGREKNEKKSLQREFEDLLRKYRKGHLLKIHRTFIRLWRTGALCDMILKTCDTQIPVHSAVVVGHSGLCEKESRAFHSSNTLPIVIALPAELRTKPVLLVVEFMYMAKIEIELATLVGITAVARELEVYVLTARCNKLLDRLLEDQNIVQTIQSATELGIDDLQQLAWSQFTKGFKVFCSRSLFQEQILQTVIKVLSADHLVVKSEFEVFEAAMAWINHKRNERLRHLPRLMECVRLIHMTDEELIGCMQYDQAFAVSPGLEILAQANMNKMLKDRAELPPDYPIPRNRVARPGLNGNSTTFSDLRQRVAEATHQIRSVPAVSPYKSSGRNVDWRRSSPTVGPPLGSPFARDHADREDNRRNFQNSSVNFSSPSFLLPEF